MAEPHLDHRAATRDIELETAHDDIGGDVHVGGGGVRAGNLLGADQFSDLDGEVAAGQNFHLRIEDRIASRIGRPHVGLRAARGGIDGFGIPDVADQELGFGRVEWRLSEVERCSSKNTQQRQVNASHLCWNNA